MLCEFGMELEIGHNSMRIIVYFQTGSRFGEEIERWYSGQSQT